MNTAGRKDWYVGNWGTLGWIETGLKAVGIVAGILALVNALDAGGFSVPEGARLAQWLIMGALSLLLLVGGTYDRYLEREIIAMIFILFNNLGHWGIVAGLSTAEGPGSLLMTFCVFLILGDLVKLRFIATTGFSVRGASRAVMLALPGLFIAGYVAVLLVEALR